MSVEVFYTSINDFLPHLLSRPRIHAIFRLTYEKHKMSQMTVRYILKVIVRVNTKPVLKQL